MTNNNYDTNEDVLSANDDYNDSYEMGKEKLTLTMRKDEHSKGKWKSYSNNNIFKKCWLELFPWVEEDSEDPKFAICRACNKTMKARKNILEAHQKTKGHVKNLSGSDDVDEEHPQRLQNVRAEQKCNIPTQASMEHRLTADQFSLFTESPTDSAHQAITSLIDKLVEKYHENRLENLKVQNEAALQLTYEQANLIRGESERKYESNSRQQANNREALELHLHFMQLQHQTKIHAIEAERDGKLKVVQQQLMLARQEYEKKVKLLDKQLEFIK